MKKFTVRDCIAYNNPCFSCGNAINFTIGAIRSMESTMIDGGVLSHLRPTVKQDHTEVDLIITYSDAVKLIIFHKTNKIQTNNAEGLTKYLASHKLFLSSLCNECNTLIESNNLDFDLGQQRINAVGIACESLFIIDKDKEYYIRSYFLQEKSIITISKLVSSKPLSLSPTKYLHHPSPKTTLELSLLPKYRFKNKQHLLEKLKLFVLFS
jgi:hypothetical protein